MRSSSMKLSVPMVLLIAALSWHCGGGTGVDAGTGGGGGTGGSPGGGTGGSTGGGGGMGGGGGTVVNPTGPIPFDQLCAAEGIGFSRANLDSQRKCGQALTQVDVDHAAIFDIGHPTSSVYGTLLSVAINCDADAGAFGRLTDRVRTSIAAGRISYDPDAAGACRDLGRQYDGGIPSTVTVGPGGLWGACDNVLVGQVNPGGACSYSDECSFGNYCKPSSPSTCGGACAPKRTVGQSCNPSADVCVSGSSCRAGADAGYLCQTHGAIDDVCSQTDDCDDALICASGRCAPPLTDGGACSTSGANQCARDSECVMPADGGFVRQCMKSAGLGEACDKNQIGAPNCADETCTRCDPVSRVCVTSGLSGDACTQDGGQCERSYFCGSGNTCTIKPRQGEACTGASSLNGFRGNCLWADNFCARTSATATDGVCTALPAVGQACGDGPNLTRVCASGYCNAPTSTDGGVSTGTCSQEPGANQPCGQLSGQDCEPSETLYCNSTSHTCQSRPGAGSACTGSSGCAPDAWCDGKGTSTSTDDVCAAKKAGGTACVSDSECAGGNCDPATHTCAIECASGSPLTSSPEGCTSARSLTAYLTFAMVLAFAARRRGK